MQHIRKESTSNKSLSSLHFSCSLIRVAPLPTILCVFFDTAADVSGLLSCFSPLLEGHDSSDEASVLDGVAGFVLGLVIAGLGSEKISKLERFKAYYFSLIIVVLTEECGFEL